MQFTESVYSRKIFFRIPSMAGRFIERPVNAFLVAGEEVCFIDAGVAGSAGAILGMAGEAGRVPGEIPTLVLAHSPWSSTPGDIPHSGRAPPGARTWRHGRV